VPVYTQSDLQKKRLDSSNHAVPSSRDVAEGSNWDYEVKFDGYRALGIKRNKPSFNCFDSRVKEIHMAAASFDVPAISREELRDRLLTASLTIIDVLPPESYAMGHIPGAINLPLESISSRAREVLPKSNAEIVAYCGAFT
jgi:hypothetical protein